MQTKAAADAVRAHIAETLDVLEEVRRIFEGPGPIRVAREDVRRCESPSSGSGPTAAGWSGGFAPRLGRRGGAVGSASGS